MWIIFKSGAKVDVSNMSNKNLSEVRIQLPSIISHLSARELGTKRKEYELLELAEFKAATSEIQETHCKLPDNVRSTFLMSFSPDCLKVASTHGDHYIYVSDVKTGNVLHTLKGHPRTPWCIAFHPTSNDILASGCLGGVVYIWHLQGRNQKWKAENGQVIASLAFHPFLQLLVIATGNALYFWDWKDSKPHACCSTDSEFERVRFVKFDCFGSHLITGISNSNLVCNDSSKSNTAAKGSFQGLRQSSIPSHLVTSDDAGIFPNDPLGRPHRINAAEWIQNRNTQVAEERLTIASNETLIASNSVLTSSMDGLFNHVPTSSEFPPTVRKLKYICDILERRLSFHNQLQEITESDDGFLFFPNRDTLPSDFTEFSLFMFGSDSAHLDEANQARYAILIGTLAHIRKSIRFQNITAGPVPRETSKVQERISVIVERREIVSGYRNIFSTLLQQISEALQRIQQRGYAGTDRQRFDLRFCLWIVEMSLDLTHKLDGVLEEDYNRFNTSPSPTSAPELQTEREESDIISSISSPEIISSGLPAMQPPTRYNDLVNHLELNRQGLRVFGPHRQMVQHNFSQYFAALSARRYENLDRRMRISDLISASLRVEDNDTGSHLHPLSRLFLAVRRRLARNSDSEESSPTSSTSSTTSRVDGAEFLINPLLYEPFVEDSLESAPTASSLEILLAQRLNQTTTAFHESVNQTHRIQRWDFSKYNLPEIYCASANVVVGACLIHNDASVDLSQDGEKLVALIPPDDTSSNPFIFGVFSLRQHTLGQVLCTWGFVSNAISVSFSPLAEYILVGLASSQPVLSNPEAVAHIVKLVPNNANIKAVSKGVHHKSLTKYTVKHIRSLTQRINRDHQFQQVSLNSICWLPQSGQGIAYATNRGCLSICRPKAPMFLKKYNTHPRSSLMQSSGISLGLPLPGTMFSD